MVTMMKPRRSEADNAEPVQESASRPGLALASSRTAPNPHGVAEQARREPRSRTEARSAEAEARTADDKQASANASAEGARKPWRRMLIGAGALVVLLAAGGYGYHYWTIGRFIVSTDDAYVGAYMSMISPKVAANVAEVRVVDNQAVKTGDVLIKLDDGDYRLAVEQAETKLATQHAAVATYDAQIRSAEAGLSQARAQLEANRASFVKAEADFQRTNTLAAREYSSKASLDAARAARDSAKAQVSAQEAAIVSAEANVGVLKAQKSQAEQLAKELQVAVAKAKRDLSFTVIRAPFDGVVGNRSVQIGDYVTPGKRLAAVVPLDKVYVDANLKETQLPGVAAGEPVKVRVDALGSQAIEGTVASIAPASGSQFSLLPPENATGNFTKIVQRVPVRIAIDAKDAAGKLRPGLSVVVDIDTRAKPAGQVAQN